MTAEEKDKTILFKKTRYNLACHEHIGGKDQILLEFQTILSDSIKKPIHLNIEDRYSNHNFSSTCSFANH